MPDSKAAAQTLPLRFKDSTTKEMLRFVATHTGRSMNDLSEEYLRKGALAEIERLEAEMQETIALMKRYRQDPLEAIQIIAAAEARTEEPLEARTGVIGQTSDSRTEATSSARR